MHPWPIRRTHIEYTIEWAGNLMLILKTDGLIRYSVGRNFSVRDDRRLDTIPGRGDESERCVVYR